jgi:glycerol-3-phosphate acyltransferase PlsY
MEIVLLLGAYVLGSIPTGLWLGLVLRGVDIREQGSKNIGATNTTRVLGKRLGGIALAGDIAKGFIPVCAASYFVGGPYFPMLCGLAAILGHTFSIFLGFKGGKGVATSAGVFFGLALIPTLIGAVVFACVVAKTRMVSAGSIAAAVAMSIAVLFSPLSTMLRIVILLVAALVIFKHRSNITRILRGEENRF